MSEYLVTGASSGVGAALARELVTRGHGVWGVARRAERLHALADELGAGRFRFTVCDVGCRDDVAATARLMETAGFRPDVVILNAGINPEAAGTTFTSAEFETVVRVNLFGALAWVDVFLPVFRARGRGRFVAVSSLAAFRGDARWVGYTASKAGLSRAFEALRGRHAREGVRFTTVHLGAVETGMGSGSRSPFRLTAREAARRVLAAVDRGADSVTIPRVLRPVLEAMRVLPDTVFSRLVAGRFPTAPRETPSERTPDTR